MCVCVYLLLGHTAQRLDPILRHFHTQIKQAVGQREWVGKSRVAAEAGADADGLVHHLVD